MTTGRWWGALLVVGLAGCQSSNATLTETRGGVRSEDELTGVVIEGEAGPRLLFDQYDAGDSRIGDSDHRTWIAIDLGALPASDASPIDLPIDATLRYAQSNLSGGTWAPDGTWALEPHGEHDARVRGLELYWGVYFEATLTYEAQLSGFVHLTGWDESHIAGLLVVDVDGRVPFRSTGTFRVELAFDLNR